MSILQVAVIAGNLELADVIQFHKPEDIGKLYHSNNCTDLTSEPSIFGIFILVESM